MRSKEAAALAVPLDPAQSWEEKEQTRSDPNIPHVTPLTLSQAGLDAWLPYVHFLAIEPNLVLGEILANDSCRGGF